MTGNKNMWRAPLAGLASLAMVATMGVAASTANAASTTDHTVTVDGTEYTVWNNESVADAILRNGGTLPTYKYGYSANGAAYLLTAPVTADGLSIKSNAPSAADVAASWVPVTFDLSGFGSSDAQIVDGHYEDRSIIAYVPDGNRIGDYHSVADAANKSLVSSWKIVTTLDDGTVQTETGKDLAFVLGKGVGSAKSITVTPEATAASAQVTFKRPSAWTGKAHYAGSFTDDINAASGSSDLVQDVVANSTKVSAPTVVFAGTLNEFPYVTGYTDQNGVKFVDGATVSGDNTYTPDYTTNGVVVVFNTNGGSKIDAQYVNKDHTIDTPASPTKANYTFKGWLLRKSDKDVCWTADDGAVTKYDSTYYFAPDFDGIYFTQTTTVDALWVANYDVTVTFHYGNYKNAPADTTATYKPNDFVTKPENPTRDDGFTFSYWEYTKADGSKAEFDFNNTLAANGATSGVNNFTLTAKWYRAPQDKARTALNYVKVKDFHEAAIGVNSFEGDDSQYFTDKSWDAFKTEYEKAYKEYRSAYYSAPNNEIDSKTADEVVNTLTAAWKGLRFDTSSVDSKLDGNPSKTEATDLVYRLSTPDGVRHLLTSDEHEVYALTNESLGFGGWNRDANTFKVVNQAETVTDAGGDHARVSEWTGSNGFPALVKKATRLYNAQLQEWLYTSDQNEIDTLTAGDWTRDSDAASFYLPAQYKGGVKVTRLYNKGLHQHLYTSDQNEIDTLLQRGWTKDSNEAAIYAL